MLNINLEGKTAIVTGATGQLGRVICQTLADCGANIIIHYHSNRDEAQKLESEMTERGVRAISVQADITDKNSVFLMRDYIAENFIMPDIIICGAVIQYLWKDVLNQEEADFYSQFESCVMHNVYMSKAFVPHLIEQGWGRYIAVNTECAALAEAGCSAYTAGKRGLDGFIRCLAKEVGGNGITVNEIAPGWTISFTDRERHSELQPDYERTVPLKRRGTDREIAQMIAFFASDLASFTTGAYIPVSGGRVMPAI